MPFILAIHYEVFQRKFYDMDIAQRSMMGLTEFVQGLTSGVSLTEFGLTLNLHLKSAYIVNCQITKVVELVPSATNEY